MASNKVRHDPLLRVESIPPGRTADRKIAVGFAVKPSLVFARGITHAGAPRLHPAVQHEPPYDRHHSGTLTCHEGSYVQRGVSAVKELAQRTRTGDAPLPYDVVIETLFNDHRARIVSEQRRQETGLS